MTFGLKLALLAFWAAWFAIVFLTNLFGALKAAGKLPAQWKFASPNYELVRRAVSLYAAPAWVPRFLFLGILAWQVAVTILFLRAFANSFLSGTIVTDQADLAFAAGILLWAAFMIADELTIKYAMEQPHELLFIAQLASLMAIHLLA